MKTRLFFLLAAAASAASAEPMLIDLPTALRLANEKNTDLAIQVQRTTRAELDKAAAWYQWVPTLRIGASYGWQDGPLQETGGNVADVERNSRYAGLGAGAYGAGMPLRPGLSAGIDLSEALYAPAAARQMHRAAQLEEDSIRLQVMVEVAEAYYGLVGATRETEIMELSAGHARQLAEQTRHFADAGEGLRADAERAEVESLIQQQKLEQARERRNAAALDLARLLRLEDGAEPAPADRMIVPLSLVDSQTPAKDLVARALATRPEPRQSQAVLEAEKSRLRKEQYGIFLPKVEIGFSYGGFGGGTGSGSPYDDTRSDLYGMVYWQFDSLGLRNRNKIQQHRALMAEARAREDQAMVDISTEVRMDHAALASAERQLDLTKRAVARARSSYELNRKRIFEKQGLPLEALQSIKALAEAEALHLAVATRFNLAQLRLQIATGSPANPQPVGTTAPAGNP